MSWKLTLSLECRVGGAFSFSCPSLEDEAVEGRGLGDPVRNGGDFCRGGGEIERCAGEDFVELEGKAF